MDLICQGKTRLSILEVFSRFTQISWNLVLKYEINQAHRAKGKKGSLLEQDLFDFLELDLNNEFVEYCDLTDSQRKKIDHKIFKDCRTYVIGALYDDTHRYFYSFSKKTNLLEINPQMADFVKKNAGMLNNLNYYKWASFYEKVNSPEKVNQLSGFIDLSFRREDESIFRTLLAQEFEREKTDIKINTLELLFGAPEDNSNVEKEETEVNNSDVENILFSDYESMKIFIQDPIKLIKTLKEKRGIV